jgi:membrane protein
VALAVAAFADLPIRQVSEIMTPGAVSVRAVDPLETVNAKFGQAGVRRLLVLDEKNELAGIISWADIVPYVSETSAGHVVSEVIEHDPAPKHKPHGGHAHESAPASSALEPARTESWKCPDARAFWCLLREAGSKWLDQGAPRLGAALAYYSIFSIVPLLLIAIATAGMIYGKEAAQGRIAGEIEHLVGKQVAQTIQGILAGASQPSGRAATLVAFLLLSFGAMGLFGEIQDDINTLWGVRPKSSAGWHTMVKDRLLSFAVVILTIVLLLGSLVVSTGIAALEDQFKFSSDVAHAVDFLISFAVITALFAMVYRILPDAHVAWRDVMLGSAVTALLFAIGKTAIGWYLGHSHLATTYGAASSVVALLLWAYYSAQIFLFGVTLTEAFARRFGSGIKPKSHAIKVSSHAQNERENAHSPGSMSPVNGSLSASSLGARSGKS